MANTYNGNWKGDTAIDNAMRTAKWVKGNKAPLTLAEQIKVAEKNEAARLVKAEAARLVKENTPEERRFTGRV